MIWEFRLEDTVINSSTWEELESEIYEMLSEFNRKVLRDIKSSKGGPEWLQQIKPVR